ncbi:STAS domain-containing protein [Peribacillus alkalitolerans]|uniref:STAS domain-containing protein n=1 Tax=Peribacillus alkalitolerans TaxID=1550385 RepID=UPI0013D44C06|nr:STAS domain-containing protein [Peribacillus alkalitolerans]
MSMVYNQGIDLKEYFSKNKHDFEERLLSEAITVREKIKEIQQIGNINLIENAHKLVLYVINQNEEDLVSFAANEGIVWAKYQMTLSFKLEWVQAIRRTLWHFLYSFDNLSEVPTNREEFFSTEKTINQYFDLFLNCFFISYSKFKDELLDAQRELVANLSVPIIPISPTICILPLIGAIDSYRSTSIEEKVLTEIGKLHIQTLILDLSGIAQMEAIVINHLSKLIDGVSMMGCKAIITGLRPEIVRNMIKQGFSFEQKAETKGSLQQALKEYVTFN